MPAPPRLVPTIILSMNLAIHEGLMSNSVSLFADIWGMRESLSYNVVYATVFSMLARMLLTVC